MLFDFHIFSKLFSMFALEEIMTDATLYASAHGTRSHALAYLVAKLKHSRAAFFLQTSRRPLETFWYNSKAEDQEPGKILESMSIMMFYPDVLLPPNTITPYISFF